MKNIKTPLFCKSLLFLAGMLYFGTTAKGVPILLSDHELPSGGVFSNFECINDSDVGILAGNDTFPLFAFFSKNKKAGIQLEEQNTDLFPDSKPYLTESDCRILFEGIDPGTGERKKELEPQSFIAYTAPSLKPYLPGKDLLQASAQFLKFGGGYIYLALKFEWHAKKPMDAFGRLKAQGAVRCHLTNEKSVTIYNSKESTWQKSGDSESFALQALFLLHPKQIKLLKENPVMGVTVYWERGYEEYPVYPIALLMNQLNCLE
ncbi:hypothetical protein KUV50_03270 [Membranicola marinus]|uniref:Uncharacterized protein n=1 Tax=Membranihabitans marinus TaxID=1227546 RepID=A0A953HK24_9BACT|nr:hypothetical protein [Membranihabitans marinus]MBY5957142.1 hypothetical protein [Membranihabitans marinus]